MGTHERNAATIRRHDPLHQLKRFAELQAVMFICAKKPRMDPTHELFRIAKNIGESFDYVVFRLVRRRFVEHRKDRMGGLVRRADSGAINDGQEMLVDEHAFRQDARPDAQRDCGSD